MFTLSPLKHLPGHQKEGNMHGDPAREASILTLLSQPRLSAFSSSGKKRSPFGYENPAPSSGSATPAGLFWISGQPALRGCTQALRQWLFFYWSVLSQHLHFRFFKCTLWLHRTLASAGGFLCTILSAQSPTAPIFSLLEIVDASWASDFPQPHTWLRGNDGFRPRPSVPKSWALFHRDHVFIFLPPTASDTTTLAWSLDGCGKCTPTSHRTGTQQAGLWTVRCQEQCYSPTRPSSGTQDSVLQAPNKEMNELINKVCTMHVTF